MNKPSRPNTHRPRAAYSDPEIRAAIVRYRLEAYTWHEIPSKLLNTYGFSCSVSYCQSVYYEWQKEEQAQASQEFASLKEKEAAELEYLYALALREYRESGNSWDRETHTFEQQKGTRQKPSNVQAKTTIVREGKRPRSAALLNTALRAKVEKAKLLGLHEHDLGGQEVHIHFDSFPAKEDANTH